jgi:hypothetical protein
MGSSGVPASISMPSAVHGVGGCTKTAGVEGPHVEDVDALHLSEDFEALETGRLLGVGGDGTGLSTLGDEVLHGLDRCALSAMIAPAVGDAMSEPGREKAGARTVELLEALEDAGGVGRVAGLLLVGGLGLRVACASVNGSPWSSSWGSLTAHKGGGEGAAGDGGGGRAPGGGNGRALEEHGASNWGGVEGWASGRAW